MGASCVELFGVFGWLGYMIAHGFHFFSITICRMFYLFFESRNSKKDPFVIWLTGGPGCSSELAVFYENGPFSIADNMSLVWNEYGWDKVLSLPLILSPLPLWL